MNNSHAQITVTVHNCFALENQPFYVSKYSCCDIMQELSIDVNRPRLFRFDIKLYVILDIFSRSAGERLVSYGHSLPAADYTEITAIFRPWP